MLVEAPMGVQPVKSPLAKSWFVNWVLVSWGAASKLALVGGVPTS
jgi:hypothetical protein